MWVSYCTDELLAQHAGQLNELLGDFDAYTNFSVAATLIVFASTGGARRSAAPSSDLLLRLGNILSPCGLMECRPATCRRVEAALPAREASRARSASPRLTSGQRRAPQGPKMPAPFAQLRC